MPEWDVDEDVSGAVETVAAAVASGHEATRVLVVVRFAARREDELRERLESLNVDGAVVFAAHVWSDRPDGCAALLCGFSDASPTVDPVDVQAAADGLEAAFSAASKHDGGQAVRRGARRGAHRAGTGRRLAGRPGWPSAAAALATLRRDPRECAATPRAQPGGPCLRPASAARLPLEFWRPGWVGARSGEDGAAAAKRQTVRLVDRASASGLADLAAVACADARYGIGASRVPAELRAALGEMGASATMIDVLERRLVDAASAALQLRLHGGKSVHRARRKKKRAAPPPRKRRAALLCVRPETVRLATERLMASLAPSPTPPSHPSTTDTTATTTTTAAAAAEHAAADLSRLSGDDRPVVGRFSAMARVMEWKWGVSASERKTQGVRRRERALLRRERATKIGVNNDLGFSG